MSSEESNVRVVGVPPTSNVRVPGVKVAVVESVSGALYQEPVVAR